jgi:hypothetical protein
MGAIGIKRGLLYSCRHKLDAAYLTSAARIANMKKPRNAITAGVLTVSLISIKSKL